MKVRVTLLLLNLAILGGARATVLEPLSLQKLSLRADFVAHAKVLGVEESASGSRFARVQVLEAVRGESGASVLQVALLQRGSRREGWVERVADAVEFRPGEEVLLFLNRSKNNTWVPLGLKQGKYRVVNDQKGVRRALSWKDADLNRVSDQEILNSAKMTAQESRSLSPQEAASSLSLSKLINDVRGF